MEIWPASSAAEQTCPEPETASWSRGSSASPVPGAETLPSSTFVAPPQGALQSFFRLGSSWELMEQEPPEGPGRHHHHLHPARAGQAGGGARVGRRTLCPPDVAAGLSPGRRRQRWRRLPQQPLLLCWLRAHLPNRALPSFFAASDTDRALAPARSGVRLRDPAWPGLTQRYEHGLRQTELPRPLRWPLQQLP
ncbi:small membrane A-kinase anchor protein isoform X1 [Monodelphis domestica]|uniref:small membrane A-kinase anchor protein isoform X1 n=1 Tax=Monodelphis domestica TaxID=13616 RepID=UPI0024E26EF2|nr:small membrane A-kinase anchor protein isoform X1 [Monodelphis domestica]